MRTFNRLKFLIVISFLLILLVGCNDDNKNDNIDGFDKVSEMIDIPSEVYDDLELKYSFIYEGTLYSLSYVMDNDALSSDGEINPDLEEDTSVNVKVSISDGESFKNFNYEPKFVPRYPSINSCTELDELINGN